MKPLKIPKNIKLNTVTGYRSEFGNLERNPNQAYETAENSLERCTRNVSTGTEWGTLAPKSNRAYQTTENSLKRLEERASRPLSQILDRPKLQIGGWSGRKCLQIDRKPRVEGAPRSFVCVWSCDLEQWHFGVVVPAELDGQIAHSGAQLPKSGYGRARIG